MIQAILLATLAGGAIPLGGWLADREHLSPEWLANEFRHAIIAFGGGALLAAVAFVLVPEGADRLAAGPAVLAFLAGGAAFAWLDRRIAEPGGTHAQLVAMLSDFIPEAIALGALIAGGSNAAPLIAGLIAMQNLPEGFNAWREMGHVSGRERGRRLALFTGLAVLGPVAAVAGHVFLADADTILGLVMVFAGGGILYLVFRDIAPQVPIENDWYAPLGAVGGFALGLAGYLLIA